MDDFLQHFSRIGVIILKTLVVIIIIRILIFALGIKIVEYVPIIDDIIELMHTALNALARGGERLLSRVVRM